MTTHRLPPRDTVAIDGTPIAAYRLGPGGERAGRRDVVICHGTPWSAAAWAPVAHELASERRVFLWDMPGYGASIGAEHPDTALPTQARRLAALVSHWGLQEPHLVAHDIGGAVALGAHLLEGVGASSLYLLDAVTLDPWGSPFFRLVAEHADVFAALPARLHGALVHEYIAGADPGLSPSQVGDLAEPWLSENGVDAFYRQIAQLSPTDTRPIVAALSGARAPARVGWGAEDPWIPAAQADELAARLAAGPARLFAGAGHLPQLTATSAVLADLREWLAARD